jgi:Tol biopolymer transport system component
MGKRVDRPYRIFVLSVIGGTLKEASEGDDNQGAPTWSRDGRFLLYGNVLCQHDHTCAIHKIDLTSGKTTIVPESQGLGTARWSPNGQYIAALDSAHRALTVFDMAGQRWRTLANGINGNDVSWSSDSLYVYTKSSMTGHAEILRVPVTGGAAQTVLNLEALSKSPGQLDTWFSLTPDNALILNRWLNASEIFALNYRGQ